MVAALVAAVVIAVIVIVAAHLGNGSPTAARSAPGSQAPSPTGSSAGQRPGTSPTPAGSSSSAGRTRKSASPSPTPAQSSTGPVPVSPLVPASGALFGAYAEPTGGDSSAAFEGAVLSLERDIHRRLAIDNLYDKWTHKLPISIARWDLSQGRIPMISWAGARTDLIARGSYDSLILASARQLRALHGPVMLRWFYEMDGSAARSLVRSPADYIAAWRHMHDIFVRAGATNVSWIWCPNALHFVGGVAQLYYPGARYVDWICADGYNWAPKITQAPWKSFASIFSTFYRWGIATGKPLMVGEFGVLERTPGAKAAWYRQTDLELRTMFPAIRAVVYFNSDHEGFDWRITTSASALEAFRAFAADPYFCAQPRM